MVADGIVLVILSFIVQEVVHLQRLNFWSTHRWYLHLII